MLSLETFCLHFFLVLGKKVHQAKERANEEKRKAISMKDIPA